jgi:hypothetical protein
MDMCWKYNESNKRLKVVLQISSNEAKFEFLAPKRTASKRPIRPRRVSGSPRSDVAAFS